MQVQNASAESDSFVERAGLRIGVHALIVTLVAPRQEHLSAAQPDGGSAANINQTYTVNLSAEPAHGTWRLRVQDAAAADVGRIDSWTISL